MRILDMHVSHDIFYCAESAYLCLKCNKKDVPHCQAGDGYKRMNPENLYEGLHVHVSYSNIIFVHYHRERDKWYGENYHRLDSWKKSSMIVQQEGNHMTLWEYSIFTEPSIRRRWKSRDERNWIKHCDFHPFKLCECLSSPLFQTQNKVLWEHSRLIHRLVHRKNRPELVSLLQTILFVQFQVCKQIWEQTQHITN